MAGGGVCVTGILLWSFIPVASDPGVGREAAYPSGSPMSSPPQPPISSIAPSPAPLEATASRRTYAIGLHELAGLPPDVAPGTVLDLWVAWEPPVTEEIQVQLLLKDVVVERLIPPVLPEGPTTVLLSVAPRDISDLLYGDRYGQLSAVSPG
jgi:hypothetical protein